MALMMGKLHDALVTAGADSDKAREAAEEVANYETRMGQVETRMTKVEGDLLLIKWMLGFNLVLTVGILWRVITL